MNENNCDVNKFENKGPFDLYHFEHDDLNKHHFFRKITEHRSKQKNPKAFVQLIDILENATGSARKSMGSNKRKCNDDNGTSNEI